MVVDPDPGLSTASEVGVGGCHAGFVLRVTIFGELKGESREGGLSSSRVYRRQAIWSQIMGVGDHLARPGQIVPRPAVLMGNIWV